MTAGLATMLINAVIIVLLAITIGYCWLLNRRIKILQDSKGELAILLKHFDDSTQRASESIVGLQVASKKIGENIQHRIDKANYLLDDLAFMIEKGNKLANQMEAGFAVGRAQQRVSAEQPARPAAKPVAPLEAKAEPVVVKEEPVAVAAEEEKPAKPQAFETAQFPRYELPAEPKANAQAEREEALREVAREVVRNPNTLEETLTRVMSRNRELQAQRDMQAQQEEVQKPRDRNRVRSRSEQELLDLIKAGIKG